MIIRTETYSDLEEDIAIIFDCSKEVIYENLCAFYYQCINGVDFDWDKFYELIDQFVEKNADLSLFDEVYVYHLARHFSEPVKLLPLRELILTENAFSNFLTNKEIVFKDQDGQLAFYYKKHLISPEQILLSRHNHLLAKRLGYLGEPDFCINGFAFWPDIEETSGSYYRDLQFGPEVIGCIERYLKINLCSEYRKKSNYYGLVFKVPLDEIIFDGKGNVETIEDKARCLLKYALLTLHGCYFHCPSSSNNPILRLHDASKVMVDHCILLEE